MKEKLENLLKSGNYNYEVSGDNIIIKMSEGVLVIENFSSTPKIIKKNNFSNYGTIAGIVFFIIVIFIDREEIVKNSLYILFVVLLALYYLYNQLILEMNKFRIYNIIENSN